VVGGGGGEEDLSRMGKATTSSSDRGRSPAKLSPRANSPSSSGSGGGGVGGSGRKGADASPGRLSRFGNALIRATSPGKSSGRKTNSKSPSTIKRS
jgi:hypothetical protein